MITDDVILRTPLGFFFFGLTILKIIAILNTCQFLPGRETVQIDATVRFDTVQHGREADVISAEEEEGRLSDGNETMLGKEVMHGGLAVGKGRHEIQSD